MVTFEPPKTTCSVLHLSEELAFTTVRLEGVTADGSISTGTGFFYRTDATADEWVPSIITNKHVVEDVQTLVFHICLEDAPGEPAIGRYHSFRLAEPTSAIVPHPSPEIDLCAIPFSGVVKMLYAAGSSLFLKYFHRGHIPTPDEEADFGALEPILMIGYPNGLWDSRNNRPLMRRGVTATHPALDLNGEGEFLIDAACFPGSSGSPVILWREPGFINRQGFIDMSGITPKLLGALYAGPVATLEGDIVFRPVPTRVSPVSQIGIPMNLGIVVKSRYLLDLEPLILAKTQTRSS